MNLAFLVKKVPPHLDAVGNYTYQVAQHVRGLGHNVFVLTSESENIASSDRSWIFPYIRDWGSGTHIANEIRRIAQLDWLSFQYVPHLYGRYGLCWRTSGILSTLRTLLKCRISVTFHEITLDPPKNIFQAVLSSVMNLEAKRLIHSSDVCITSNERYAKILQTIEPSMPSPFIIPIGSNIPSEIPSNETLQNLRKKLGFEKTKLLAFFGRLTVHRNHQLCLQLLAAAKRNGITAKLVFLGSLSAKEIHLLKTMARDLEVNESVILTGKLSEPQISEYLFMTDLFLFPQEAGLSAASGAVSSAISHGLPILSFHPLQGSFNHWNYPGAILVKENNPEAFIEAGLRELANETGLNAERRRKFSNFKEIFSWSKIAERYAAAFEKTYDL